MNNHRSPSEYGGGWRVELKGIDNEASIRQMYVARSLCRRPPSGTRKTKSSSLSSSTSLICSLKACLHDPKMKSKKGIAKYKVYTFEGDERNECGNANISLQKLSTIAPEVASGTSTSSLTTDEPRSHHTSSPSLSPSQNPNTRSVAKWLDGLHASLQTCKEPPNLEKTYFGCPMQKLCICKDDESEDQGNKKEESSSRAIDDQDRKEIRELMEEMRTLQEIVEKLSLKESNMMQEERKVNGEISELNMKLFVDARKEKFTLKAMLPTWFCIAIVVGVLAMKVYGMMNK